LTRSSYPEVNYAFHSDVVRILKTWPTLLQV